MNPLKSQLILTQKQSHNFSIFSVYFTRKELSKRKSLHGWPPLELKVTIFLRFKVIKPYSVFWKPCICLFLHFQPHLQAMLIFILNFIKTIFDLNDNYCFGNVFFLHSEKGRNSKDGTGDKITGHIQGTVWGNHVRTTNQPIKITRLRRSYNSNKTMNKNNAWISFLKDVCRIL